MKEVPGWTVTPTKQALPAPVTEGNITIKEAVTSVTWTAKPGTMIAPGQFAEFEISAGPVPDVDSLQFPTTQTYNDSDGRAVERTNPGIRRGTGAPSPDLDHHPCGGRVRRAHITEFVQ